MRILFLTQSGPSAASSRYRVTQYLPHLQSLGWKWWVAPAVPSSYHDAYFFSRKLFFKVFLSCFIVLRRLFQMMLVPFADIVFVQKPLLPPGWPALDRTMRRLARKVVFDFDDAIFLSPPERNALLPDAAYRKRFEIAARSADLVLAGNAFLAAEANKIAARVEVFPTVVDTQRFCPKDEFSPRPSPAPHPTLSPGGRGSTTCIVGWMGSPSTAMYLKDLRAVILDISKEFPVRWVFVGSDPFDLDGADAHFRPWIYGKEVKWLHYFDIFISPLRETPWEEGKCGLKTLTAMSAGLPVIASAVGVHKEIIRDGENGYLVRDDAQWKDRLLRLMSDVALRKRMGEAARKTVETNFSLDRAAPRFAELLRGI